MNWILRYIQSSIGKKQLMAVTGLLLAAFLVIHLIGNLPLFLPILGEREHAQHALNLYAAFLQYKKIVLYGFEAVMLGLFGVHMFLAFQTRMENAKARGPRGYEIDALKSGNKINNKWMLWSGIVIAVFLVVHIATFKYDAAGIHSKANIPEYDYVPAMMVAGTADVEQGKKIWAEKALVDSSMVADPEHASMTMVGVWKVHNLYGKVEYLFHQWWYAAFYLFCMVFLAIHLGHAITSALQTLGANHVRFNLIAKYAGLGYTVAIAGGNAAIVISMYLSQFVVK